MSELMKKIVGQLTDANNNALGQFPFGITIEFTKLSDSDNPGGWIGSAPIKSSGQFDLFTAYNMPYDDTVNYKIFKDTQLLSAGVASTSDFSTHIAIDDTVYKSLVQPYVSGCVTIKGSVTLGPENIAAIPENMDNVIVEVRKVLFREEQVIASTPLDRYGNYYIDLPLNLLSESSAQSTNHKASSLSKVFVTLRLLDLEVEEGQEDFIEKSGMLDLSNGEVITDFHIDEPLHYSFFKTEMDFVRDAVLSLLPTDNADIYSIVTEGKDTELETIASQTGLGIALISKIVYAAKIEAQLGIYMAHSYALVNEHGTNIKLWPAIGNASYDQIRKNVVAHIIPDGGGSERLTANAIIEFEKEKLFETLTQNGDTMGAVWSAVINDETLVKTFLYLNANHIDSSREDFWAAVEADEGLSNYADQLKKGVQILSLNGMQPEMTAATFTLLNSEKSYGFITANLTDDVRTLSLLTQNDWYNIIAEVCNENDKLCIPLSIIAQAEANSSEPKDEYATKLFEITTNVFATTVIKNQLNKDINDSHSSPPSQGVKFSDIFGESANDVLGFLNSEDNADFDFRTSSLWNYTDEQVPFRSAALPIQNLMRLTMGRPNVVIALAKDGMKSSGDIVEMSPEAFIQKYVIDLNVMTDGDAQVLYARANNTNLQTIAATVNHGGFSDISTQVWDPYGNNDPGLSTDPDWQNLFGNLDLCGCSECTSMYSPAAYYTDILRFTRSKIDNQSPESRGYKELNQRRRPDLAHVELSCKNTNTAIPYVDLVNELLELVILKSTGTNVPFKSYQTTGVSKELNAYPEHTYKDANGIYQTYSNYQLVYDNTLSTDISSPKLPFNLPLEESRAYLNHLGFKRYDLMDQFKSVNYTFIASPSTNINPFNLSAEWLSISKKDAEIITNTVTPAIDVWKYFGFLSEITSNIQWYNLLCEGETLQVIGVSQTQGLNTLLERSEITYKELLQLLNCNFLNPQISINITNQGLQTHRTFEIKSTDANHPDTCDLTKLRLIYRKAEADVVTPANSAEVIAAKKTLFQKWHRFLRLQKATGWSMYQLDMVLASFGYPNIDASAFINIAKIHKYTKQFKTRPERLCAFWSPVSIVKYIDYNSDSQNELPSVFDSLFRNKALKNPTDSDMNYTLNAQGGYIAPSNPLPASPPVPKFETKSGIIIAGVNIKEEELFAVLGFLGIPTSETLKVKSLGLVYGIAQVAKGLGYSIADLLRLLSLFEIGGAAFNQTSSTELFKLLEKIVTSVSINEKTIFSLEETEFLLADKDDSGNYIATEKAIQLFYEGLRTELKNLSELKDVEPISAMSDAISLAEVKAVAAESAALDAENFAGTTASNTTATEAAYAITSAKDKVGNLVTVLDGVSVMNPDDVYNAQPKLLEAVNIAAEALSIAQGAAKSAKAANDFAQLPSSGLTTTQKEAAKQTARAANTMYAKVVECIEAVKRTYDIALKLNARPNVVIQYFTAQFSTNNDTSRYLLKEIAEVSPALSLLDALASPEFINTTYDVIPANNFGPHSFSELFDIYRLLRKTTFITNKYKLDRDETKFFIDYALSLDVLKLDQLPVTPTVGPASATLNTSVSLELLSKLNDWIKVKGILGLRVREFIEVMSRSIALPYPDVTAAASTKADWINCILEFTSWKETDLKELIGDVSSNAPLGGGLLTTMFVTAGGGSFKSAGLLLQLINIMDAIGRIGLSAKLTHKVLRSDLIMDDSRYIRTAAKSKHNEDAWLKIAKPLQDVLREKQRAALVAYILARPYILDTNYNSSAPSQPVAADYRERCKAENDLFAYLLIDVEMKPCMATSRIKQAISSVQLYLDRIILNLENYVNNPNAANHITMSPSAVEQWKAWRKWYRVWEANRKIFLYPENWIEPELRDDKTPVFKELETALLQDEVKDNIVEDAFRNYLEQLEEIGHLEPVGIFRQQENKYQSDTDFNGKPVYAYVVDKTHVFGRTSSLPHRYYYRCLEDNIWTPWEKVNVDIKSDHITPVMWNGKLYLFWLTFQKKKPSESERNALWSKVQSLLQNGTPHWQTEMTQLLSDADNDGYNTLDITLNWSQYKDNKWLANELSKDTIEINPSKVIINAATRTSIQNNPKTLEWLTNNKDIKIDDLFKNRLYLFQTIDEPLNNGSQGEINSLKEDNGIAFSIMFAPGLDETATGIHRFLWHGDNHITPYVSRNASSQLPIKMRGYQLLSPSGTRLNKMKFVEDPYGDGKLKQDEIKYIYSLSQLPDTITPNTYFSFESNRIEPGQASITRASNAPAILGTTNNGTYKITARASRDADVHTHYHIPIANEFLFEDEKNTFFVRRELKPRIFSLAGLLPTIPGILMESLNDPYGYRFQTFYHTKIGKLIKSLNKGGIAALLDISNQKPFRTIFNDPAFNPLDEMKFGVPDDLSKPGRYAPTSLVHPETPDANMQFNFTDAYGTYNWEMFFHAPMLIAQRLSDNQQFEEAQKWYHYIFNPTSTTNKDGAYTGGKERFWKFYPFYEVVAPGSAAPQTITELLTAINSGNTQANAQVTQWEKNPFNPHLIARMRKLAYMKNVLMKYIDNLLAWGDQLFSRDTIESINEATQLYVLAANLLGKKPQEIPARAKSKKYSFAEFANLPAATGLNALSNVMVNIESFFPPNTGVAQSTSTANPPIYGTMFYFCIPKNDILLGYWGKVADRLFKIRNCMNIEGTVRQLPLFEPPIDPAMLVRATAMSVDINTILDSASGANLPHYRFSYMLQKANEFCGEVRGLGNSLLSALEKKDAEQLSLLRSGQELQLMEKITFINEQQVVDAEQALEVVKLTRENTEMRFNYYDSRSFMNPHEIGHLTSLGIGMVLQTVQAGMHTASGTAASTPTGHAQGVSSGVSFGGINVAMSFEAASRAIGIATAINNGLGSMSATMGGYKRRQDDWKFQADTASKELEQLDQQILGAEIRLDIAKKELANHEQQVENTTAVDAYMRSKFTSKELYSWMVSQIATTYFQSYQLAYDLAKKADACYKYELPLAKYPATGFVTFGYWDSLRKGLMSGEKLQFDLRKMEATYMEENEREFELTKNISLVISDPRALLNLRKDGSCEIYLPEEIYDIDYPGHYNRRIKSVSISIPCIAGPYTTIPATLTLASSYIRKEEDPSGVLTIDASSIGRTMIATSSAQNDSGVFELNFRDERYLPFEGRGAVSKWGLNLAAEGQVRTFDFDTISDVIMHVRYTAVQSESSDPSNSLKQARIDNINNLFISPTIDSYNDDSFSESSLILPRYFSIKHEFSHQWYKGFDMLVSPASGTPSSNIGRVIDIKISSSQFPEYTKGKIITISNIHFVMKPNVIENGTTYYLMLGNQPTNPSTPIVYDPEDLFVNSIYGLSLEKPFTRTLEGSAVDANLSFKFYKKVGSIMTEILESNLEDIFFIVNYKLS